MNLIEAVKSGKPFRRSIHSNWMHVEGKNITFIDELNLAAIYKVLLEDILAEDWEIQDSSVTITRFDLQKAWSLTQQAEPYNFQERLAKELGL